MGFDPPADFNLADHLLDARVREGLGDKAALLTRDASHTYREVQTLANRFARVLRGLGLEPEQRVLIALPDGPAFVGALFGAFKAGAVAVMANPALRTEEIAYFLEYTRARVAVVHAEAVLAFAAAAEKARWLRRLLTVGGDDAKGPSAFEALAAAAPASFDPVPTHRDDACLWLFSGGTTGRPKAVIQSHRSYANTTELYAKGAMGYRQGDVTLSVPKLFFGYATGSNLFFPFSVGATAALYPEHPTAEVVFENIRRHRPTILVNVPAMVSQMCDHPDAGEPGPVERADLHFGRRSPAARAASTVPGPVRGGDPRRPRDRGDVAHLPDQPSRRGPAGNAGSSGGRLRREGLRRGRRRGGAGRGGRAVGAGASRAIGYWQQMDATAVAFRGEWYVTGDLVWMDGDGYVTYAGRADDMLKVSGKWVAPAEVENCLLSHPAVRECAVVGAPDPSGLLKPRAYVVTKEDAEASRSPSLAEDLKAYVRDRPRALQGPREVVLVEALPRTHLGKVDRGKLRKG
jgi:acyl-coenzyme A synthetase/AMP-(fatty) acid ligase